MNNFRINPYPCKYRPDPVRPVHSPLKYYSPKKYPSVSRYGSQSCLRLKHNIHPNKFLPQTFDNTRAKESHSTVYPNWIAVSDSDSYHRVTNITQNRLDIISLMYYDTPTLWWVIAKANPEILFDPYNIPVGITLRIPAATTLYSTGGVLDAE